MPRSAAPPWKKRLDPVLDHLIHASVAQAGGKADDKGAYSPIHYTGCGTIERAREIKRAAHRTWRYTGYSVSAKIKQDADGTYRVIITAHDKAMAKAYMLQKYGADRTRWPYSPKSGDPNYGGNKR